MLPPEHAYRAYKIDNDGHIIGRVDLHCDDDETAKQHARALVDGYDIELWDGGRKIAIFKCPKQTG
jgi:hypothetical protein